MVADKNAREPRQFSRIKIRAIQFALIRVKNFFLNPRAAMPIRGWEN
jgi:hypothetical protein